jgi:hypothetical protein
MSTHISDDLPRLLTGDASRDEVLAAAEHLRGCPDCQQELVSAVVAHASLTSAQRFAPEIMSTESAPPAQDESPAGPLPDMSAIFARVREEAAAEPAPSKAPRRRRLLAVAASAAVLVAGGVTIAETVGSNSSQSSARSVSLAAFGVGTHPATATIFGNGTMRINATALPKLNAQHFYEVWLTDAARKNMQSLGSIGNNNRAELTVASNLMTEYSAIEVSVQRTNQPAYSGTSVLRGSYG